MRTPTLEESIQQMEFMNRFMFWMIVALVIYFVVVVIFADFGGRSK